MEHITITPSEIDAELIAEAEEKILDFVDEFQRVYAMQKDYDETVCKSLDSTEVRNRAEQMLGDSFTVEQAVETYADTADAVCSKASLFRNKVAFDCHVESDTVCAEFFVDGRAYDYGRKGDLENHIVGTERDEQQKERLPEYGDDYER